MIGARLRGVLGIAAAQLAHDRSRVLLAVAGVALAVLAMTLLASVGIGVGSADEARFEEADRDLWVTGGPVRLNPGAVGGFENGLHGAHELAAELESREAVRTAAPVSFQTVYVSADGEEFDTVIGTGAPARGSLVYLEAGEQLPRDTHYAGGTYEGEMTHAVVVAPEFAKARGLEVGDTLYVGGTLATARDHEFTVVGVSPTYSKFLGAPTVTMHLSELQQVTGTTHADSAALVTISLAGDANAEAVAAELDAAYPAYDVRTNREQFAAVFQRQALLLASGASLVVLAVLAGFALTANLLLSMVYGRREELAALRSLGASAWTLAGVTVVEAGLIGAAGGAVGAGLTVPAAAGLNRLAAAVVGFEGLVDVEPVVLLGGVAVATLVSCVSAALGAWRILRASPLEQLSW